MESTGGMVKGRKGGREGGQLLPRRACFILGLSMVTVSLSLTET